MADRRYSRRRCDRPRPYRELPLHSGSWSVPAQRSRCAQLPSRSCSSCSSWLSTTQKSRASSTIFKAVLNISRPCAGQSRRHRSQDRMGRVSSPRLQFSDHVVARCNFFLVCVCSGLVMASCHAYHVGCRSTRDLWRRMCVSIDARQRLMLESHGAEGVV